MAGSAQIIGLPALQAALAKRIAAIRAAEVASVAAEVVSITKDAREAATVDKGDLRGGIYGDEAAGEIRATARHSAFNEFGTSKMAAQPFMEPAARKSKSRFVGRVSAAMRKAAS